VTVLGKLRRKLVRPRQPGLADGRQRSRSEIHDYWRKPPDGSNQPTDYLDPQGGQTRSHFLVSLIDDLPKGAATLEVGCNVGRNLHHLYRAGYTDLTAIEISADAVAELHRNYPDTAARATILNQPAEEALPTLASGRFDLVFTMAVLVHVHPDSEHVVFPQLARVASGRLITLEDERSTHSWRHFPRSYDEMFKPLGFQQTRSEQCDVKRHGLPPAYQLRVFERVAALP
jgi:SAM-dependent methyltransferase